MTTPAYATTPAGFFNRVTGFTVTSATAAKVLVEPQASAAASGNLPQYYGGCSVIALEAGSTDGSSKDIDLWVGEVLTTQDSTNTGTMATTATTNGTVTRASGSFITDGWKIGDVCMVFTPDNAAQAATTVDGLASVITAVAALTITISGTTWTAQTLTAASRLVRVSRLFRATVAANAGNTNAIANVNLLGHANDNSAIRNEKKLGANAMLIGAMTANPSALPAAVTVHACYARY